MRLNTMKMIRMVQSCDRIAWTELARFCPVESSMMAKKVHISMLAADRYKFREILLDYRAIFFVDIVRLESQLIDQGPELVGR